MDQSYRLFVLVYSRYGAASFSMGSLIKIVCAGFDSKFDYDQVWTYWTMCREDCMPNTHTQGGLYAKHTHTH